MFLDEDAIAGADQRQPFRIINGKILTQHEQKIQADPNHWKGYCLECGGQHE